MESDNENFNVIVPEYLTAEEPTAEDPTAEEPTAEEPTAEEPTAETIDYSSILQEMNSRLENIEAQTVAYNEGINGLLANIYFLDFVAFAVFVFLMLFIVIKFFKIFF